MTKSVVFAMSVLSPDEYKEYTHFQKLVVY